MAYRSIKVEGEEYRYLVGTSTVAVQLPRGGGTVHTTPWEIKGGTPDLVERGRRKKTSDGMVTPREVADWIRTRHLGLPPAPRPAPSPGPEPDGGEGAYWIRCHGVDRRVAALWSRAGGWTFAGEDAHPVPGSMVAAVLGPVQAPRPDLWHVVAWRHDVEGGTERVTVGAFTDATRAKEVQVSILERVAAEMEPLLGKRCRPLEVAREAHAVGLDRVWHVDVEPMAADAVLVDVMADSAYRDASSRDSLDAEEAPASPGLVR